jgi:hypothetical protein
MFLDALDRLRGAGKYSTSVPPMDGALKPNDALDAAEELYRGKEPDNLVVSSGTIHFTIGNAVVRFHPGEMPRVSDAAEFSAAVTCLAAFDEQMAVGLEIGEVRIVGGRFDGMVIDRVGDRSTKAPVAAHFENAKTLLLALGSQVHPASAWKRDLMEGGASGSVWRIDLSSGKASVLCDHMAFPYGITLMDGEAVFVSESWRHRIVDVSSKRQRVVVDDLPFYPARISATASGEVLVCGFAPRRQLFEFILHERQFLRRMMSDIPEQYWMAPALSSGSDYWEPLQQGQIRHHGILKPWSPTKSYGLLATMDGAGRFLRSIHCRAGGVRHGITSAVELGSQIIMTSKGGGMVLAAQAREA